MSLDITNRILEGKSAPKDGSNGNKIIDHSSVQKISENLKMNQECLSSKKGEKEDIIKSNVDNRRSKHRAHVPMEGCFIL